jgi:citrate synthase
VSEARLTVNVAQIYQTKRTYASSAEPDLKETLKKVIPAKRELLKKVKAAGDKKIGDVKIENTIGGMRCVMQPLFHQ